MKNRILLFTIFTVTLFSLGLLMTVLFNTTPADRSSILLLYCALGLGLIGVIFFAQYITALIAGHSSGSLWQTILSQLRFSTIATALLVTLLLLQASRLLNIASAVVLIVLAIMAELILRKRTYPKL